MSEIIKKGFLKPVHEFAFRHKSGKNGKINGVILTKPEGLKERLCYELVWEDGFIDYTPVSDVEDGSYKIVQEA